jgi:hypothetical protein
MRDAGGETGDVLSPAAGHGHSLELPAMVATRTLVGDRMGEQRLARCRLELLRWWGRTPVLVRWRAPTLRWHQPLLLTCCGGVRSGGGWRKK